MRRADEQRKIAQAVLEQQHDVAVARFVLPASGERPLAPVLTPARPA
jgi:hypothetical protein